MAIPKRPEPMACCASSQTTIRVYLLGLASLLFGAVLVSRPMPASTGGELLRLAAPTRAAQVIVPPGGDESKENLLAVASDESSNSNKEKCPTGSTLAKPMILDFANIKASDNAILHSIQGLTFANYEKYLTAPAGNEHYTWLHYLATYYADPDVGWDSNCHRRHMTDIGTRYVTSALSMASAAPTHPPVWTFDIPTSRERTAAFRGKTEEEWQTQVKAKHMDITFHNLDLLAVSDEDFEKYMNTWFIMLDTFHQPYTVPFEREWLARLIKAKFFKGIVGLDDIHLNPEMKQWWKEVQDNAERDGYVAYDITKIGHITGTGLLDFSGGLVTVVDNL